MALVVSANKFCIIKLHQKQNLYFCNTFQRGVVLGTRIAMTEFLPRYKTIPCGIILNNASIVGLNPFQEIAAYSTTKTAVVAFTRAVGTESYLDKYSSICCAVCPGLTETAILSKGPNEFDELVASNEKQTLVLI